MKKLLALALAALILLLPVTALADTPVTVSVMDSEIVVSLTDNYDILTRDFSDAEAIIEKYNLDKEWLLSIMREESRYLEAFNTETENEIMITSFMDATSSKSINYSEREPEAMESAAEKISQTIKDNGDVSFYNSHWNKFIKYTMTDGTTDAVVYTTVENGRQIEIAAYAFEGKKLTPNDLESLQYVVDSMKIIYLGKEQGPIQKTGSKRVTPLRTVIIILVTSAAIAVLLIILIVKLRKRR